MNIGVFLSANNDISNRYHAEAERFGTWLGRQGHTLVYGGSNRGLMNVVATAAKGSGGSITGIVPPVLDERGWTSNALDCKIAVADLSERKEQLIRQSDLLVVLPGGIGTLDELFTALGFRAIGIGAIPVVIYNVDGCWDSLVQLLRGLEQQGMLRGSLSDYIQTADTFEQLTALISQADRPA